MTSWQEGYRAPLSRLPLGMTDNQSLADAEATAAFLRALRAEGVPASAAVQLAAKFLETRMIGRMAQQEPKPPWEEK